MTRVRPGLCSVTFRELSAERVIELVAETGLEVIEWGGDVHLPPGDIARAERVARWTADAGVRSCSYGSYFRAGVAEPLDPVLDSAQALGVDRVRIWAGAQGSAHTSDSQRAEVVTRLRDAAAEAEKRGITLALEFHAGTLADSAPAALSVLDEVGSAALSVYWQPAVGAPATAALADYRQLAPRVSAVHVFSWWPTQERLPLQARDDLWSALFAEVAASPHPPREALLEFLAGDDPDRLPAEAAALLAYFERAGAGAVGSGHE